MAKTGRGTGRGRSQRRDGRVGSLALGALLGALLVLLAVAAYFTFGSPPVAVSDKSALWEPLVQSVPLNARARAESKRPPFAASEEVFEAAARTYRAQCTSCHGAPGAESAVGRSMLPQAPQFFSGHPKKGKTADTAGEIYWTTAFGVRRSGMPAYRTSLSDTQLWQLALLLQNAGDLPDPVHGILTAGLPPPRPSEVKP